MNIYEIALCILFIGIMLIAGIALLIYWALFNRDYWETLARYKALINGSSVEDLDDVYNREFPTDFSVKEIQEWYKGDKDGHN